MAEILNIDATGAEQLSRSLADVLAELATPHDLLDTLGGTLEANIQLRFESKQDPNGQPWVPLKESTLEKYNRADRVRSGPNAGEVVRRGSLLERTGQMRASLNHHVDANKVAVYMSRLTPDGEWQIPMLHELGTRRMERRGIFTADPATGELGAIDQADLDADIVAYLNDLFGAA